VVNGHPDPRPARFCSALCDAYEEGARAAGWTVRRLNVGALSATFDCLAGSGALEEALKDIQWATQMTVVFPLWGDQAPPGLRTLFQENRARGRLDSHPADEKPVRMVITMEMPAFLQRAMLRRNMYTDDVGGNIALPGFSEQQRDFIGSVASIALEQRRWWLETMRKNGRRAA